MALTRLPRSILFCCICAPIVLIWTFNFLPSLLPNPPRWGAAGHLEAQEDAKANPPPTSIYSSQEPSSDGDASSAKSDQHLPAAETEDTHSKPQPHPIDRLVEEADTEFHSILEKRTSNIHEAAEAYRTRRGRHPPPGFELWHEYAEGNDAVIVEDFWDQIYDDLEPFWAIPVSQIRSLARKLGMAVVVENGAARATTDWFWHVIWAKMIGQIAKHLPDMVIPLNPMDEPRLIASWDNVNEMVTAAQVQKLDLWPPQETSSRTTGWGIEPGPEEEHDTEVPEVVWKDSAPYSYARLACPPKSPIRRHNEAMSPRRLMESIDRRQPQQSPLDPDLMPYMQPEFVSNYSEASGLCNEAAIAYYHGALTDPLTASTSTGLLPMFGGSKLAQVNNDILLPAPMYWNEEERFAEPDRYTWSEKSDTVIWRGTATGGWNKPNTWSRFHRHRFVALTNGTKYEISTQSASEDMFTSLWHLTAISRLKKSIQTNLGRWLSKLTDLHVDFPQDLLSPLSTGGCDRLGLLIVALYWLTLTNILWTADKVLHDAIEVVESVIHRHKVLPRHETGVVPLAVQSRFDRERVRQQEGAVATGERVSVDIGEILGSIL